MAAKPRQVEVCCELSAMLRPKTYPFGVKFYETLNERPEGAMRPRHPMNTCQITAIVRYYGRSMYFTAEDMACIVGGVTLGLIEEPENMKNGEIAKMLHADLKSAAEFTRQVAKIPYGKFKAVAVAPMAKVNFEPDVVVMYGNTAQVMRVVQGYLYEKGGRVHFSTGGEWSLCADSIAQAYISQDISLGLPCFGDRKTALAQEDEITVAFPYSLYEKILEGMRKTADVAAYPVPFDIGFPQMPDYTLTPWSVEYRRKHLTGKG
ncbi:MAG: DUF169 domain-containing protein [Candidatus Saccharicenans sp.]|nr:MAG: hypothetical protein C0168_02425 [Candidatus Aminicenantes bacterium]HEK86086.1 hypothetical protein [Candidatus Aminicenantes bacterium]